MSDRPQPVWRSLEGTQAARGGDAQAIEFSPERRDFLRIAAASLAMATGACSPPRAEIVPHVSAAPGAQDEPLYYATAMTLGGSAAGVLVRSNMGRPTKIEGNRAHPSSRGATDVFAQASILQLWDPDRAGPPRQGRDAASSEAFLQALRSTVGTLGPGGDGLRILTGYVASPTLAGQLRAIAQRYPASRHHVWEPLHRDHSLEGARLAFGRPVVPVFRLARAEVIVSLEADFLGEGPGHLAHALDFAATRRDAPVRRAMSRLYACESVPSLTGAAADHAFAMAPAEVERFLGELGERLRGAGGSGGPRVDAVAKDLLAHRGRSIVVAGESLPAPAHALVHALNALLEAPSSTVDYIAPPAGDEICAESIRALVDDMRAGRVRALLILGGNPVLDAPADLGFAEALTRVPFAAHHALHDDETSAACAWHLPAAHYLEQWSDALAHDGSASIVQPVVAPLYGGLGIHDVLSTLLEPGAATGEEAVRTAWRGQAGGDFEARWREALRAGVVAGSASPPEAVQARRLEYTPGAAPQGWTLCLRGDASVRDGEFANNAWLQELPRPLTKLTWDNAALLGPATASELGVASGDKIEIATEGRSVRAPVWVLPGQADRVVALFLGYGRTRAGRAGDDVGVDAYPLRRASSPWRLEGVRVRKVAGRHAFATTQEHWSMEGREPIRRATLAELVAGAATIHEEPQGPSMYPPWSYDVHRWGMSIDLTSCIGCNACTIACQAENNIPSVGKRQVALGREMHWIRVDRYYAGSAQSPATLFQPVPCMHCETAPCEVVCPVEATQHDSEGINVQVYNRCVGTRFCSNNCPYKVRRFNFLQFTDLESPASRAMANPEVTVRMRGVMEKCNYCLQRVTRARIGAERDGRAMVDGDVVTACQSVCPTRAIAFGDLNDPASEVVARKASSLDYALLGELNTLPRTTYLARVRNPNPDLEASA